MGLLGVAAVLGIGEPAPRALAQQPAPAEGGLEVVQIRPDFYMIAGAGGNIAVQIGPIGVMLVDAGSAPAADTLLATIKRLTNRPIRYIISTSADADHVGGNEKLSKAGVTILGGARGNASFTEDVTKAIDLNGGLASVLAHEEVLARMSRPAGATARRCGPRRSIPAPATRCPSMATAFRSFTSRPHTPMATASCSFAAPTSS